jgi:hypothetical protein
MDNVSAACPSGEKILGGGAVATLTSGEFGTDRTIVNSWPSDDHTWTASDLHPLGATALVKVYAICANVST